MSAGAAYNRDDVDQAKQKEAIAEINEIITNAEANLEAAMKRAQDLADKFDIEIYMSVNGHGSTYVPKLPADWAASSCSDYGYRQRGEWNSSSMSC